MSPASSQSPWKQLSVNEQFRWLLTGNTALFFGFFATVLLRSMLAWELTGDEMSLAFINLVSAICLFGTSLVAGVVIDRVERRRLMFLAQLVIFCAESTVLTLLVLDRLSFNILLLSSVAASGAFPFIMPARTAMLVEAVGKPRLGKATALVSGGVNIARMVSPAIVGILVDLTSFVYGYIFLLSLHLVSLFCTVRLRAYPAFPGRREGFFRELSRGFRYLFDNRPLGLGILFGILPMLVVIPIQNLMVVFVEQIWDAGGSGLGIMMGAMGIGGLLGSLCMALLREGSLAKPMVGGTLSLACFLLLMAHSPWFWMGVVMVVGAYACSVFAQTLVQTAVQLMAEDHIRGRITTINMMSISVAPLGTIPLAYATRHIGPEWSITIAALLLAGGVLTFWFLSSTFRRIDSAARPGSDV